MITSLEQTGYRENIPAGSGQEGWMGHCLTAVEELREVVADLTGALHQARYSARDIFAIHLAVEEAVVNAVKHGHRDCPNQPVWVRYQVTPDQVLVEVEDQGPGFDPDQVPDPRTPGNLERCSGRGLFLMRHYSTWVHYNERGNRVTLCKRRSKDNASC